MSTCDWHAEGAQEFWTCHKCGNTTYDLDRSVHIGRECEGGKNTDKPPITLHGGWNERPDASFVRAVLLKPDDDVPRLVFADWLDEHGESERAEFIRLQCKIKSEEATPDHDHRKSLYLDNCPRCKADLTLFELRNREKFLLFHSLDKLLTAPVPTVMRYGISHGTVQVQKFAGRVTDLYSSFTFDRGFITEVRVTEELAHLVLAHCVMNEPVEAVTLNWPTDEERRVMRSLDIESIQYNTKGEVCTMLGTCRLVHSCSSTGFSRLQVGEWARPVKNIDVGFHRSRDDDTLSDTPRPWAFGRMLLGKELIYVGPWVRADPLALGLTPYGPMYARMRNIVWRPNPPGSSQIRILPPQLDQRPFVHDTEIEVPPYERRRLQFVRQSVYLNTGARVFVVDQNLTVRNHKNTGQHLTRDDLRGYRDGVLTFDSNGPPTFEGNSMKGKNSYKAKRRKANKTARKQRRKNSS